jgi:hypothetical protein
MINCRGHKQVRAVDDAPRRSRWWESPLANTYPHSIVVIVVKDQDTKDGDYKPHIYAKAPIISWSIVLIRRWRHLEI